MRVHDLAPEAKETINNLTASAQEKLRGEAEAVSNYLKSLPSYKPMTDQERKEVEDKNDKAYAKLLSGEGDVDTEKKPDTDKSV